LYGELLALQFVEWLADLPDGTPPQIIEAGAHDGQLAKDILALAAHSPEGLALQTREEQAAFRALIDANFKVRSAETR